MAALALALLLAPAGVAVEATDWSALQAELDDGGGRDEGLEAFARSGRAAITDRLKAAQELAKNKDRTGAERLSAQLLVVRLQGVAGKRGAKKRKKALKAAAKMAKQLEDKATADAIKLALTGDTALAKVEKANARILKDLAANLSIKGKSSSGKANQGGKKRKTKAKKAKKAKKSKAKGASSNRGGKDLAAVKAALGAWETLDDAPRGAAARLALLVAQVPAAKSKGARNALRKKLGELVQEVVAHRDVAPTLKAAHQLAAQLSWKNGAYKQAALHALAADRAARPPAREAWASDDRDPHGRSRATREMCEALSARKLSCATLEEDRWGDRTFWDFSRVKARRFSNDTAREVLAEYDGLLKGCIDQSNQLTEFDTEVQFAWTVEGTGRVTAYTVRPRHLESGAFRACSDAAFDAFRYPRFRGPAASVSYNLDVDLADAKLKP